VTRQVVRLGREKSGTNRRQSALPEDFVFSFEEGETMGRGILLWLLGVPIPVIILLALFYH
jgi:hypothetical protein